MTPITANNHLFPIFLKLEELRLCIVGGGPIGLEKLEAVLANSPKTRIKMIAKDFLSEILELAETHDTLHLIQKPYQSTDLDDVDIVIAALGDPDVSAIVRDDAKKLGLLINAADKPSLCDFYLGSIVKKGQLKIAISTNGKSPTVAKRVKEVLNDSFPDEIDETLNNLAEVRTYLKGDFTSKVKQLNQLTASLSDSELNRIIKKTKRNQWLVGISLPALLICGYFLGSYMPAAQVHSFWFDMISKVDETILVFILAGFLAQLIDGALGMAYGVTATTVLLSFGLSPVAATASVHTSEVFTSGVSGLMHLKFGNVNNKLFRNLLLPGVIGAIIGAYALSSLQDYNHIIKPLVSGYTLFLGLIIIFKALKKDGVRRKIKKIFPLAFAGGFLDSIGGGGWGPIVSSTLMAQGKAPRYTIGSVNLAEFFVALASSITFFTMIGTNHWNVILGLILGGTVAAPIGAYLTNKIPAKSIMIFVGIVVIILSLKRIFF